MSRALPASANVAALARVVAGLAGTVVAVGAVAVAEGPARATTYAGSSATGAALTLAAGLGLITAGLVISLGRRPSRTGDLALLAGSCWFAPALAAWRGGPPLVLSIATVAAGFTFPFILHLVLTHPADRVGSKPARALTALVYAEALIAGAVLALFRDPYYDSSCLANCTVNSFLVRSLPSLAHVAEISDRWFTAAAATALIAVCAWRLVRASWPARQRLLLVYLPAMVFAAAVIARAAALQRVIFEDPFNPALSAIFAAGSVAITLLAAGLISGVVRARAERQAVAEITANLNQASAAGWLQSALAAALRDPGIQIAFWLPGRQCYVNASGQAVPDPSTESGRVVTRLTRNERTIAVISHSGAVPAIESQIGPAIRLGLENERLQAESLAELEELRTSRARIVETADSERRRLERNLHDGAQQRLLALSYDIRVACAAAHADGDAETEMALGDAAGTMQGILGELRDLAHGIYPAVLAEAGIGPALATLADTAPLPVQVLCAECGRYPAPIEAAAYFAVAEAVDDAARRGADHAAVSVAHDGGRLVVTVEDNGSGDASSMVAAADRVGALGGSLTARSAGTAVCRAEIPCASS